ncbi:hypothetical protein GCM10009557_17820 [Virgisporangium ochraceum]|uniref:Uncharacterized protein n=2 Tax=Virgisporangium ochraceum TaxID=65505 RepID=A0A8J3ZYM1_9ACTN|nr:hypothetical protein Voc01_075960 [Virgisporangium ochraceum]
MAPYRNDMDDVMEFVARWRSPHSGRPSGYYRLARSRFGNVNATGEPAAYSAPDLTPHDAQWLQCIEEGVRPLVRAAVGRGWVTYNSCAGHVYAELPLRPACREIGVLPVDDDVADDVRETLVRLARTVEDGQRLPAAVDLQVWRNGLRCLASGRTFDVYDVVLAPAAGRSVDDYFQAVGDATATIASMLATTHRPT